MATNAKAHGVEEVRELIESKGARLFWRSVKAAEPNPGYLL
jgi:hypothetical protein